jgi:hypothetical protein
MTAIKSKGVDLIAAERQRQIYELGWSREHDEGEHQHGQLADAAVCYAATLHGEAMEESLMPFWPWERERLERIRVPDRHPDRVKRLAQAGALIAAEIDRLLA